MAKVEVVKSEKANNPNYVWSSLLAIVGIVIGVYYFCSAGSTSSTSSNKKISGCYYITNSLFEGRSTSLCINTSTVTFSHEGSSATLYSNWIGDKLYIENEYGDTIFKCNSSREDSSIQCTSYNKMVGTGTNVWVKK